MGPLNSASMDYDLDVYLQQSWYDPRLSLLRFGINETVMLSGEAITALIWKPDLYFVNAKRATVHDVTAPNELVQITPGGYVLYGDSTMTAAVASSASNANARSVAAVVVLDHQHRELASAFLHSQNITDAEEVAIALAITHGNKLGRLFHVLADWHMTLANSCTFEHLRSGVRSYGHLATHNWRETRRRTGSFKGIQAEHPSTLPLKHPFQYQEAISWRLIQAGAYPDLHLISQIHPTAYPSRCPAEWWESLLASEALDDQLSLIERARMAVTASGALDSSGPGQWWKGYASPHIMPGWPEPGPATSQDRFPPPVTHGGQDHLVVLKGTDFCIPMTQLSSQSG
ncbi:hypothetical protein HPB49_015472 [Dermacentor silvarum]|uniref:Uncharacterized protein n=1 Tax=Dermacentor silvarum TaxID=543639 RepID=A0ACB8CLP9_DERSI|nr:hypothetical protein HPB49_015472 [Dermacentor silvarum]